MSVSSENSKKDNHDKYGLDNEHRDADPLDEMKFEEADELSDHNAEINEIIKKYPGLDIEGILSSKVKV